MPTSHGPDIVALTIAAEDLVNGVSVASNIISDAVTQVTKLVAAGYPDNAGLQTDLDTRAGVILAAIGSLTETRAALVAEIARVGPIALEPQKIPGAATAEPEAAAVPAPEDARPEP